MLKANQTGLTDGQDGSEGSRKWQVGVESHPAVAGLPKESYISRIAEAKTLYGATRSERQNFFTLQMFSRFSHALPRHDVSALTKISRKTVRDRNRQVERLIEPRFIATSPNDNPAGGLPYGGLDR